MRVIELNPPGWGGQSPLQHRIDQRDLATVLAAAVEELGIGDYHLHGASMGGVTALWLAVQFPSRVRSLSIEGGMNFVRECDFISMESIRVLERMVAEQNPDGEGYPRAAPHPRKPWLNAEFFRNQMRKRLPMMRLVTNSHEEELRVRLKEFEVPTLVLLGDRDELLRPSHLERWREVLPSAQTQLISGGAHDLQNTEPEQFVHATLEHIRGVSLRE
jgi:pimeloyl-ACP methyl ester carboxylesterase